MKQRGLHRREFVKAASLSVLALAGPWAANAGAAIDRSALGKLAAKLRGRLIAPGDPDYNAARRVWNARFDRHPAAIAQCAGADDVARCIEFARRNDIPAAVRSGGHSQAGLSVCDGGLVIDLSRMKRIEIDPTRRTARAEPGVTRAEFDREAQKHGLVTPMGQCQDVGLGGLVLGGGEGALCPRYGASCDNVLDSEIVLADSRILQAEADRNPDLLWGICGGAGNLGTVTRLGFQLYPLREVVAGWVWYPFDQARGVMRSYREASRAAPDDLFTELCVQRPDDRDVMATVFVFHSDPARAARDVEPFRKLGRPARESIKRRSYLDGQAAAGFPVWTGWSSYQRSGFLPAITDELIDAIAAEPSPQGSDLWFSHLHGAISRHPIDFNAYHQRTPGFTFWAEADWQGAEPREAVEWVDRIWKVAAKASDGVYVNMLDVEPGREREAYGANYQRLAELKKKYDPDNFFRMNVNVKPA